MPPTSGRRRCRWAPAAGPTSSSGCGPAGRSPPSPPAARTASCRWPPARSSTGGCSAVSRLAVRRRGPLRRHPLARGRRQPTAPRRPGRAVGGRGAARLGLAGTRADRRHRPRRAPRPDRARAGPGGPRAGRAGVRQPRPLPRARLAPGRPLPRAPAGRLAAGPPAGPHLDAAPHRRRSGRGSPGLRRPRAVRASSGWRPAEPRGRAPGRARGRRPALRPAAGCRRCARPGPAGPVADNFLDVAHFAFVHGATFGAEDRPEVPVYDVVPEPGGFRSTQEQWCENPTDPEVARGGRPLRQRRRATYVYRAPFQFRVCLEYLDTGATTTILFLLQPEDADSTRIYTCLFLSAGPRAAAAPARGRRRARSPSTGRCWRRTSGYGRPGQRGPAAGRPRGAARPGGPAGRRAAPGAVRLHATARRGDGRAAA